ncbi:uncharacterized protein UTRI_10402 [Ustilago trichophora]|uniref:Uncharacterized protein n=1 Tax=Ustilago trichophora TaxID=86804 RepID=A0A5C3EB83_9BASI|nr:uncharacterized protein UTRI_10402 [Ustilago trichophora]
MPQARSPHRQLYKMRVLALVACLGLMATFFIGETLAMEGSGHGETPEYRLFPQDRFLGTFPMKPPSLHSDLPLNKELGSATSSTSGLKRNDQFPWELKKELPWVNIRPSDRSRHPIADIPEFEKDGRKYGPFQVGLWHFEPKPYPIGFPHIIRPVGFESQIPADFEHYVVRSTQGIQFIPGNFDLSVEPGLLRDIQSFLHRSLEQSGLQPELVSGTTQLKQGDYLWPPVKISKGNPSLLNMLYSTRSHLHQATRYALRMSQSGIPPKVYHLRVPSAQFGSRHIMMFRGDAVKYTTMSSPSKNSEFWFLNEVMADRTGKPSYFILGGTFLPKDAPKILEQVGIFKPAFQHLFNYAPEVLA